MTRIEPGLRRGVMRLPVSKSHAHRVLIAEFLAGRKEFLAASADDCDDVKATKRCLLALADGRDELDCGESGTTRRLLGPVAAALGRKVKWVMKGRLAERPQIDYEDMKAGVYKLPGDISSQFVSGLLFALPLLDGDSEIRLTSELASRGYVSMTEKVLCEYGIEWTEDDCHAEESIFVSGNQRFMAPAGKPVIERDWSSAAFVFALQHLGNEVAFCDGDSAGLDAGSFQPDSRIVCNLEKLGGENEEKQVIFIDEFPDSFPILSVVAAARRGETMFLGTKRLRFKECDRIAAMADVLARFGVETVVTENEFTVLGTGSPFRGGSFASYGDHRIAMSVAVGATRATGVVEIDDLHCSAKSYPTFFDDFTNLELPSCGE